MVEVIPLRFRTVEQVVPVLRPMLKGEGSTVSGHQGQLIVRTSPANLEEIKRILASIDTPARRLLITVVEDARSIEADRKTQSVQVAEGSTAFIRVGQPVPVQQVTRAVIGGQVVEQVVGGTRYQNEYRDVVSGFYALPRLSGDRVTLEISSQREAPSGAVQGGGYTQRAVTTVSGRLGEWMEIGGIAQSASGEQSVFPGRASATASDMRRVLVKVEELK